MKKESISSYVSIGVKKTISRRHAFSSVLIVTALSATILFLFSATSFLFVPLWNQAAFAYVPRVDPVTSDCAPFIGTIFPVSRAPNWGAMYSASEWDRTYEQLTTRDFVAIPPYIISELVMKMADLLLDRIQNMRIITEKLFYSTRYYGAANLDSGEFESKHPGVDIKLALNTPLLSIAGGTVHVVDASKALGSFIIIKHCLPEETLFSVYGHMDTQYAEEGDPVLPGTVIGTVGMTGRTTAPHLHLQVDRYQRGEKGKHMPFVVRKQLSQAQLDKYTVHPIDFIADHRL